MAERKSGKPGRTFGLVAAIGVQALVVAALIVALDVGNGGLTFIPDISIVRTPDPKPPKPEPPVDPNHIPGQPTEPTPVVVLEPVPCDCMPGEPGPSVDVDRYPVPSIGSGLPAYPASEKRLGHEGVVVLKLCVDERGRVTDASVAESSGYPVLDRAALEWAENIRWRPAMTNGHVVALCFNQPYRFRLKT